MISEPLYKTLSATQRWLITLVVMSATLLQVIDTTIVNVALTHMQGSLSASADEITWTLTSYLVSSAIFMPLTGYFADRLGRKNYFFISIAGFTLVSALCGASTSLTEMVIFRFLQGIFGAALVPLSQATLADIFPPEERGKAMAIWGVGVMVGPVLGPSLGGYLTDVANWRWTFYVNVPVGICTLLLANIIPDTAKKIRSMDWLGLVLLSFAIGGLQYVFDRGNQEDWFNSSSIRIIAFLTMTSFLGFILHNFHKSGATVFDLRIFRDRNFTIASVLLGIFCLGLYGMMVIQPMMMEGLLGYPALTTGLILAPRGLSSMISMIIVGKLIQRIDARWFIMTGILFCVSGMSMSTYYSLNINTFWLVFPLILQGLGMGMVFVPLSIIAYSTLPLQKRTEAAGLFSLLRTLGGSIGISITITWYTRNAQFFWSQLSGFVNPYNPALYHFLEKLHLEPTHPIGAAIIATKLAQQASMISFINVCALITLAFLAMIPFLFLLRKAAPTT